MADLLNLCCGAAEELDVSGADDLLVLLQGLLPLTLLPDIEDTEVQ